MCDYISSRIHAARKSVRKVATDLISNEKLINNSFAAFILACMAYMTVVEIHHRELDRSLVALRAEVEELKLTKGE